MEPDYAQSCYLHTNTQTQIHLVNGELLKLKGHKHSNYVMTQVLTEDPGGCEF